MTFLHRILILYSVIESMFTPLFQRNKIFEQCQRVLLKCLLHINIASSILMLKIAKKFLMHLFLLIK